MGGSEFVFGTLESGLDVHIEEIPADVSRKTGGFIKSETSKIVNKLYPAFIPTHFLGEKQTMLRRAQGSPADRCDGQLAPITKFDAPPLSTNGCGTGIFKYDYRPFKEAECCVHHDYCWGPYHALFRSTLRVARMLMSLECKQKNVTTATTNATPTLGSAFLIAAKGSSAEWSEFHATSWLLPTLRLWKVRLAGRSSISTTTSNVLAARPATRPAQSDVHLLVEDRDHGS